MVQVMIINCKAKVEMGETKLPYQVVLKDIVDKCLPTHNIFKLT